MNFKLNKIILIMSIALVSLCFNSQTAVAQEESISSVMSSSNCSAGGEIWVCGTSQLAQAHDDFKNNCSGWDYQCGKTLKTILNVCAPQIVESKITSEDC